MFYIRKSWTKIFIIIIKLIKLGGNLLPINTNIYRLLTDIEIPYWIPILPLDIICIKSQIDNINGEWIYHNKIKDKMKHTKYILYIHGGAFCMCKAETYHDLLYRIAKKTNFVIFSVNYRRAPEYKYPIPLNDCIKSYLYLLEIVKESKNIIIAGDSAGGNIVINLIAYLIENNLPQPLKCILISPWTDLTDHGKNPSWNTNKNYDYIRSDLAKFFALEYIDKSKNKLKDISPLYLSEKILSKFPPILVEYGECEVLHDQIYLFCKKLDDLCVNIEYNCRSDMIHNFPLFHFTGISQSEEFFNTVKKFVI
jgi:monoterpene epsilon-lactone hydrolase